ncbi:MAG: hypothetical protein ABI237_07365 [Ginsengibacter sp.]
MYRICYLIFGLFIISCNSAYTSKKRGYFKIDLPQKSYITFNDPSFPYSFEYPAYARIAKDSSYFKEGDRSPYSIDIVFPALNGTIFISYKDINGSSVYKVKKPDGSYRDSSARNSFEKMVNDSYHLTYKNDIKASSIEDSVMHTPNAVTGIFFKLSGNVATAKQFFLSDTTQHFLRGALYFDATPNEDSLRPVNAFLQEDMKHLINTLKWKKPLEK